MLSPTLDLAGKSAECESGRPGDTPSKGYRHWGAKLLPIRRITQNGGLQPVEYGIEAAGRRVGLRFAGQAKKPGE